VKQLTSAAVQRDRETFVSTAVWMQSYQPILKLAATYAACRKERGLPIPGQQGSTTQTIDKPQPTTQPSKQQRAADDEEECPVECVTEVSTWPLLLLVSTRLSQQQLQLIVQLYIYSDRSWFCSSDNCSSSSSSGGGN
jgi:hypothetical protein